MAENTDALDDSSFLDFIAELLREEDHQMAADALERLRKSNASNFLMMRQREGEALDASIELERARKRFKTEMDVLATFAEEMTAKYVMLGQHTTAVVRRLGEVLDKEAVEAIRPELTALRDSGALDHSPSKKGAE
jgi:hypothetical protein